MAPSRKAVEASSFHGAVDIAFFDVRFEIDGQSLPHANVEEFPAVGELLTVVDISSLRINFTESWKPVVHSLLNDSFQMTVSVNKPLVTTY
ncbi:hypothetical protein T03_11442 [Trichinella britovi]|uniref:Uncharacterized protein n=1 Tax=Trichinella britovi TaxID=45882 RepID=A0A0V1C6V5_TRIBR|nr:hypothetical protein T03_11442 [Trichinella britovi]